MLKVLRWKSRYRRLSRRERGAADGRARGAPLLYFTIQPVGWAQAHSEICFIYLGNYLWGCSQLVAQIDYLHIISQYIIHISASQEQRNIAQRCAKVLLLYFTIQPVSWAPTCTLLQLCRVAFIAHLCHRSIKQLGHKGRFSCIISQLVTRIFSVITSPFETCTC